MPAAAGSSSSKHGELWSFAMQSMVGSFSAGHVLLLDAYFAHGLMFCPAERGGS